MNKFLFPVILTGALLSGCEPSAEDEPPAPMGVQINSVNGTVTLEDTFTAADLDPVCMYEPKSGEYIYVVASLSSNELTVVTKIFDSTDTSCSGTLITEDTSVSVIDNIGSKTVGWTDGIPPDKADGSGPMDDNVNASKMTVTLKSSTIPEAPIGTVIKSTVFYDDTTATLREYTGNPAFEDGTGFHTMLFTTYD